MTQAANTYRQFDRVLARCRDLFVKKYRDYGTAWRVLRPSSLTDQIQIKARRIRTIQETGVQQVQDSIESEFVGIINYSVMALIQLELPPGAPEEMDLDEVLTLYDHQVARAKALLKRKNHDYGEAWRVMRVSSITDLILMKLLRLKQIEENNGHTLVSEGREANYLDILIYAFFALVLLEEKEKTES